MSGLDLSEFQAVNCRSPVYYMLNYHSAVKKIKYFCVYYIIYIIEKTSLINFREVVLYIILLKFAKRCNLLHRYITFRVYLAG